MSPRALPQSSHLSFPFSRLLKVPSPLPQVNESRWGRVSRFSDKGAALPFCGL